MREKRETLRKMKEIKEGRRRERESEEGGQAYAYSAPGLLLWH